MTPRIHVLLPVHNRKITTERFVRRLLAQTYANWHLLLIDDGSTDGTEAMVRSLIPALTVLRGRGRWWWAGALQQGYAWLKQARLPADDLALIINDDTEFGPDFLAQAVATIKPRQLLLARCYDLDTGQLIDAGLVWDWPGLNYKIVKEGGETPNCFSTRGLFLHVGDFLKIGGFYPLLLPHYLSDYEFTQRAHDKGFQLVTVPEVSLRSDEKLTGIRTIVGHSLVRSLRMAFSIRSATNPFYWTSFVLLACPLQYIPANILRVWRRFVITTRRDLQVRPAKSG